LPACAQLRTVNERCDASVELKKAERHISSSRKITEAKQYRSE
jgi:hypothetical protein